MAALSPTATYSNIYMYCVFSFVQIILAFILLRSELKNIYVRILKTLYWHLEKYYNYIVGFINSKY